MQDSLSQDYFIEFPKLNSPHNMTIPYKKDEFMIHPQQYDMQLKQVFS